MGEVETESVENLSIVLAGVSGDISDSTLTLIQTVLEDHTNTVVSKLFPAIHFRSTVHIILASPNEASPGEYYNRKRNLRLLDQQERETLQPSVTIQYNELIEFKRLYGMEDLNGNTLASLALQTPDDREEFVNKIHNELDNDDSVLQSLVSVSMVELPPTISPSSMPTPTLAPTIRRESNEKDNLLATSEEDEIKGNPTTTDDNNFPLSTIIPIFCLVLTGLALVGGAIFVIVRRKYM